jgi:hypothetical protein
MERSRLQTEWANLLQHGLTGSNVVVKRSFFQHFWKLDIYVCFCPCIGVYRMHFHSQDSLEFIWIPDIFDTELVLFLRQVQLFIINFDILKVLTASHYLTSLTSLNKSNQRRQV